MVLTVYYLLLSSNSYLLDYHTYLGSLAALNFYSPFSPSPGPIPTACSLLSAHGFALPSLQVKTSLHLYPLLSLSSKKWVLCLLAKADSWIVYPVHFHLFQDLILPIIFSLLPICWKISSNLPFPTTKTKQPKKFLFPAMIYPSFFFWPNFKSSVNHSLVSHLSLTPESLKPGCSLHQSTETTSWKNSK